MNYNYIGFRDECGRLGVVESVSLVMLQPLQMNADKGECVDVFPMLHHTVAVSSPYYIQCRLD